MTIPPDVKVPALRPKRAGDGHTERIEIRSVPRRVSKTDATDQE
jgi:hypothetical protein